MTFNLDIFQGNEHFRRNSAPRTKLGFNLHQIRGAASCAACGLMYSLRGVVLANIMAAIFDFNDSEWLGSEINLYKGLPRGRSKVKNKERG